MAAARLSEVKGLASCLPRPWQLHAVVGIHAAQGLGKAGKLKEELVGTTHKEAAVCPQQWPGGPGCISSCSSGQQASGHFAVSGRLQEGSQFLLQSQDCDWFKHPSPLPPTRRGVTL